MEMILGNRNSKTSARIKRWTLRIQEDQLNVTFYKREGQSVRFLYRHRDTQDNSVDHCSEQYTHFLSNHAIPKALEEIKTATKQDSTLQRLWEVIRNGDWKSFE